MSEAGKTGYDFGDPGVPAGEGETWGEAAERLREEDWSVSRDDLERLADSMRRQGTIFKDGSEPQNVANWCADQLEELIDEESP